MLQRIRPVAFLALALLVFVAIGPASAQQSTAYQINRAHTGYTELSAAPVFPLTQAWAINLPDQLSYPIIAEGKVFVLSRSINGEYGARLYAIDANSGATVWRKNLKGSGFFWGALTYGDERLYAVTGDGQLTAFDPQTGSRIWSIQLPWQRIFTSAPTFSDGIIYTGGAGSGGTVYAINASNGSVIWSQAVANGDQSSPAVSDSAVYVSYVCNSAYSFDALTGAVNWTYSTGCSGGGGRTAVLSRYGLFTRDSITGNFILNKNTGKKLGVYDAITAPAFAAQYRITLTDTGLHAHNQETGALLWSFSGDGTLSSAPIIVNRTVFVGGTSGMLYALNRTNGNVLWSTNVGAGIQEPDEHNASQPLTGLAAGEGLIVVPAGSRLVAYRASAGARHK